MYTAGVIQIVVNVILLQGGPPGVPSNIGQPLGQSVLAAGQTRPPMQAWGPPPPSQRPAGPVHPPALGSSSAVAPPPQQVLRGGEVPGPRPGGDFAQMQQFGAHLPRAGPHPAVGPPPVNPLPMSQPGVPPPTHPPQTMMNVGFGAPPESRPPGFSSQGASVPAAAHPPTSDMSGRSQPLSTQPQMNAGGMAGYNYAAQPRGVQPAGPATGTPLTGPMSQPQPRKLDPDQMPSPVSLCVFNID